MGESYPFWKKLAWRFGRVFASAYFISLGDQMIRLSEVDTWRSVGIAAFIAALSAVSKLLREGETAPMSKLLSLHKLPF